MDRRRQFPSIHQTFNGHRTEPPVIEYKGKSYSMDGIERDRMDGQMNLVLCLDGTECEFGLSPYTNVLKIFRMLEKDDSSQLCYYQPGIGVKFHLSSNDIHDKDFLGSQFGRVANKLDAIFAFTLEKHVIAGYKFLMKFYRKGDRVFLFGFRGSFTGRVLAGMIERVGLLNSGLDEMIVTAWQLYSNWEYAGQPAQQDSTLSMIDEFKETFCRKNVDIHFMGLWDSVNSVGIMRDRLFPFTIRSAIIKHVRHAVSIDERRAKYKQVLFEPHSYIPHIFNLDCEDCEDYSDNRDDSENTEGRIHNFNHSPYGSTDSLSPLLEQETPKQSFATIANFLSQLLGNSKNERLDKEFCADRMELFFPGNHGDIGGGWPPDTDGQYLSDIPFRWIVSQAVKFGVQFKPGVLHEFDEKHPVVGGLLSCHHDLLSVTRQIPVQHIRESFFHRIRKLYRNGSPGPRLNYQQRVEQIEIGPRTNSGPSSTISPITSSVSSNVPDLPSQPIKRFDARGDSSIIVPICWWVLECLPFGYKIENTKGEWKMVYVPNFGRPRKLPKVPTFHWSVFYRIHYIEDYRPKNLPKDLGPYFLKSIENFRYLYDKTDLESLATDLTIEKIKNDTESDIWRILPDDLSFYLKNNSDI